MSQELQFARQSGVTIIPVMMEGGGWRASGWLGLVTAGALWTSLHDPSSFDDNVRALHAQIERIMQSDTANDAVESVDVGSPLPHEATEELRRLRDDLTLTSETHGTTDASIIVSDSTQPTSLPAGIPQLPPNFRTTNQVEELLQIVLSTSADSLAKPRIGFHGT